MVHDAQTQQARARHSRHWLSAEEPSSLVQEPQPQSVAGGPTQAPRPVVAVGVPPARRLRADSWMPTLLYQGGARVLHHTLRLQRYPLHALG
jgi:hypothetical protein